MVLVLCGVQATRAQTAHVRGLVFGDAYAVASSDDADLEGQNGLWFRRINLTFDFELSDHWSSRMRMEMASNGTFTTSARMEPFAKDAYLRWQDSDYQLYVGLSGTPTWSLIEEYWGYRPVEKTMLDLQKMGASRDIGVAFRGATGGERNVRYHVMVGNGNSTSSESNKGKKGMLSISVEPAEHFVVEAYADVDDRPGDQYRYTLQGFLGYRTEGGRLGIQFFSQTRHHGEEPDVVLNGLSVFGALPLSPRVNGFARVDHMFDKNPDAGKITYLPFIEDARSTMLLAGVDIQATDQVHFMPNVEAVFFDAIDGETPAATVMPRVTFFYTFK